MGNYTAKPETHNLKGFSPGKETCDDMWCVSWLKAQAEK